MDIMTIALAIAGIWMCGLLVIVSICRSAARADRALSSLRPRFSADSHEFRLAR